MLRRTLLLSFLTLLSISVCGQEMQGEWHRGLGKFTFTGYEPLSDKPIEVYFYIPYHGDVSKMRVLFSVHGAERSGDICVNNWREIAEKEGFVVIAPEYSKKYYKENDYQFGGVMQDRKSGEPNPAELWTYNTIEAIFDLFKQQTGSDAEKYDMCGHSAGGQFTHRFLLAMPQARVATAIAANPGSWTFLLPEGLETQSGKTFSWPYSTKGTPMTDREYMRKFLARNLVIHLGTADRATSGTYVPTDEAALAQGEYRFERGKNFYKHARRLARRNGWEFNWRKIKVRGVGHSGKGMIYGKYETDADGQMLFDIDRVSPHGAYKILYKK